MVVLLRGGGSLCPRTNTYSSRVVETASRISWKAWLQYNRVAKGEGTDDGAFSQRRRTQFVGTLKLAKT